MNRFKKELVYLLVAALVLLPVLPLSAKIVLPHVFSDNMVLQQQTNAPIWGKATPNKNVKVFTSWDKRTYVVKADVAGKWQVEIETPVAGGPYSISISDGKELLLSNVLIGEVWLCSGQSNMEMPLAGWGRVLNYQEEIQSANYPQIRLFHVDRSTSSQPLEDIEESRGGWQICSPETVAEFTSVGYFFGRDVYENLHVPVGLISSSWGGTVAEAWTSGEALEYMPDFKEEVLSIRKHSDDELLDVYLKEIENWNEQVAASDEGLKDGKAIWAQIDYIDSDWQDMPVPNLWENAGLKDYDGIVWLRKTVNIPSDWSNKELQLNLGPVDDDDVTYFNGYEIGTTSGYNINRTYTIPAKLVKPGKAVITVRVTDNANGGGIYGDSEELYLALKSNVISARIPLSGEWKYSPVIDFKNFPMAPVSPLDNPNRPTVLYNAMISPLIPYAIQGVIWYQGESNASRAYQYRDLFPLLIRDWRKQWNKDFPFYYVQLANFMDINPKPQESDWAELREAQLQALQLANTGMAVAIDIGDAKDIHPKNKQEVGRRLALNALANTYNKEVVFSGPIYDSYRIEGNKIRVSFKHAEDGLKTMDNKKPEGFAIAGPDHLFYWADATIENGEVVVSSSEVEYPVAVRYAWADNPVCNLYNKAGLPASPFRTDDWK